MELRRVQFEYEDDGLRRLAEDAAFVPRQCLGTLFDPTDRHFGCSPQHTLSATSESGEGYDLGSFQAIAQAHAPSTQRPVPAHPPIPD